MVDDAHPYVQETNLAPTSLTLNAGAGGVTVGQNIGSGKPLQNLTITSGTLSATGIRLDGNLSVTNSGAGSVTGVIAGPAAVTKAGGGVLTLSGANTYTGATSVNAGTLKITNGTGLGTTADATTVASGATLDVAGGISVGETLNMNGTLVNSAGNNTWSGPITLGNIVDVAAGSTLTVSGPIGAHRSPRTAPELSS